MNKKILALITLLVLSKAILAQVSLGFDVGAGAILNERPKIFEHDTVTYRTLSFPMFFDASYQLPPSTTEGGNGSINAFLGFKAGLMNGTKAKSSQYLTFTGKFSYSWISLPVYFYGRLESEWIFAEVGAGAHVWGLTFFSNTGDVYVDSSLMYTDIGVGFTSYARSGIKYSISESVILRSGLSLHSLIFKFDSDMEGKNNVINLGFFTGLSFEF